MCRLGTTVRWYQRRVEHVAIIDIELLGAARAVQSRGLSDVLQHVFEYRKLLARRELLRARFDTESKDRLEALERLFASDPGEEHRRQHARCDVSVPATIKAGGRIQRVEVVNVGGGGICVAPAPRLSPGERAVVRIVAADKCSEYHYPVQALWVERDDTLSAMGLPFVGAPLQVTSPI